MYEAFVETYRFNIPKSTLEMNVLNYHNLGERYIAFSSKRDSHFSFFFAFKFSVVSESVFFFFITSVPFHIVLERDMLS